MDALTIVRRIVAETYRRDRVLALFGWFHLVLLAVTLTGAGLDERVILGINPWIKPMKFMSSTTIFLWTVAWLMAYVPGARGLRVISWGVSLSMTAVVACVSLQSARGTTSSFNVSTPFNTLVYATMGVTIAINTVLVLYLLVLFCVRKTALPPAYLWGIRLGLAVFVLGSIQGGLMSHINAHTVGRPDGGLGLPLVNWSTEAGDLRVAHMLGVHALQAIPLVGFLLSRPTARNWIRAPVGGVVLFTLLYSGATTVVLLQALSHRPLISL